VAALEAEGLVAKIEPHVHTVPHGDRSGVPVEPWLTDQWYVDAGELAKPAIAAVEEGRTIFVPKNWQKTYFEWMRNIQPWSISRQLWWGHQIPAWYGPDGRIFVEIDEAVARSAARAHYGKDVELTRDPDVLDTWFSSALWPFSTLGWPASTPELARYYPTDVLVTGFDIIFFWVARMMMMGLKFMGEVPFRTVYIHALVRDAKGQKMSKSKGNIIDPLELIDRYGCDALRFTLAALAAQGRDVRLAESRVEGYRNFATKLWNAARYCQMNGCVAPLDFKPASAQLTVNKWILGELAQAAAEIDAALEAFRFNDVANALYHFTWGTFCDWYLEFTKPVLNGADVSAAAETRGVTGFVLSELLKLLHPLMPFITEELWDKLDLARGKMLITTAWPALGPDLADAAAKAEMDWVLRLISRVRSLRAEYDIPGGEPLGVELLGLSSQDFARLKRYEPQVQRLAWLATIETTEGALTAEKLVEDVFEDIRLRIPVDNIDIGGQRKKFEKLIARSQKVLGEIDQRLSNPQFMSKAGTEVIEVQQERRKSEQIALDGFLQALKRLSAL
jgi:valyl-tRNA synthetase